MFIMVAYDIADHKRLRRVAKVMEGYGHRVQRSIFECDLTGDRLDCMIHDVRKQIKKGKDKVQLYMLCRGCRARVAMSGLGVRTAPAHVLVY